MQRPVNGVITQGFHAGHQALDIAGAHRSPVYAPHDGVVTHAGQLGSGTNDAGLAIDINGGEFVSRLGHNDQILVYNGQRVKQGQHIAYQGFTGYTQPDNVVQGSHVHWVLWRNGTRVNPANYITTVPIGGNEVANAEQVKNLYRGILRREADAGGLANYTGRDANAIVSEMLNSQERKNLDAHIASLGVAVADRDKVIAQLRTALANEQAKPPKEVIKEVEKIVDRPVEVIKEVPVYVNDEETRENTRQILKLTKTIRALILNLFKRK
jgi:hypothetical protein